MTSDDANLHAPEKNLHIAPIHHRGQKPVLRAVAMFEFAKGLFVMLMGLCALLLVHKDAWLLAESVLARLHISTDRRYAQDFLAFADNISDARLWTAASLAFTYGALRLIEAYGLWRQRAWAEWLAFIAGTVFLPLEVRELMRGITLVRSVFFVGNLAVVLYMYYLIRHNHTERKKAAAARSAGASQG